MRFGVYEYKSSERLVLVGTFATDVQAKITCHDPLNGKRLKRFAVNLDTGEVILP